MTNILHFWLPSLWYTPFFLQVPIKIACFVNFQKIKKNGRFCTTKFASIYDFFFLFPHPSFWHVREVCFLPPNFDRRLKTRISSDNRRSIINDNFFKKSRFSPDQDIIKAFAQKNARRKGPSKKFDKIMFKVHGPRSVFTYQL